ncbi:MAG: ORF6N domain-containing protein [Victivallaceae bacterium]
MSDLLPIERIESKILLIRGKRVLLAYDLADLYGVSTKRLNEQVKRNMERFPEDFMFQLNNSEFEILRSQFATAKLSKARVMPYAFTEHGALMTANVVNSQRAVLVSVAVVRAFVRMREILLKDKEMNTRLEDIEERLDTQEMNTIIIMDKLRSLTNPPQNKTQKIGFDAKK